VTIWPCFNSAKSLPIVSKDLPLHPSDYICYITILGFAKCHLIADPKSDDLVQGRLMRKKRRAIKMIILVIGNNQDSNEQMAINSIASFWLTYKTQGQLQTIVIYDLHKNWKEKVSIPERF
jgi:hypothetical protein